ncbi:MAG: hypothetical protein ABIE55_01035 [Candidatus Aenigmatarchaeota archaeon]
MPIPNKEGHEFIKKTKFRFGSDSVDTSVSNSDYSRISLYSGELPILTVREYAAAERIGKKHKLNVVNQDFGKGEGAEPEYETVYHFKCTTLEELRKAPKEIATAITELEKELGLVDESGERVLR